MTLDLRNLDLSLPPRAERGGPAPSPAHFVELYEDDRALVESVRTFVSVGIAAGEVAVVVATAAHREAIEAELGRVLDLPAATAQGLYLCADAEETLDSFLRDGRPDAGAFEDVVGGLIDRAAAGGREVRVFGEMVALLWERGSAEAAFELEDLWNRLAGSRRFRLFCAYAAASFADDDGDAVAEIAMRHSHVVVPERRP